MTRLASALERQQDRLLPCVHCGFCLPACPTYVRLGDEADSPRGRLHLMKAVVEGRLRPEEEAFQVHLDRCLGCRACETVCPSGVEYGLLLEAARAEAAAARRPGFLPRALLRVFGRPALLRPTLLLSRWLRRTGLPSLAARRLPGWGVLGRARLGLAMLAASGPAPRLSPGLGARAARARATASGGAGGRPGAGSTRERIEARAGAEAPVGGSRGLRGEAVPPAGARPRVRVALLEGCVQQGLFGRVNRATTRVLEANGYEVVAVPGQACCGALHAHAGALEEARRLARRNLRAFEAAGIDVVVVNAAGCGAAMREYGHLLSDDPETAQRAKALAGSVRDVSELLAARGPAAGAPLDLRVTYDAPCHLLHAQRVADPPLAVLRAVPGLELVALEGADECCGGAGLYGITHPDLGGRIGADKVEAVLRSGAELVATGNPGCMMQIGAGLRMRGAEVQVVHPVELLDASYRAAGMYGPGRGSEREPASSAH